MVSQSSRDWVSPVRFPMRVSGLSLSPSQIRTVSPHTAVRNVSSIELFSVCYFIPLSCRWLNGINVYSKRDFSLGDPPLFSFQTDVHGKPVFTNSDRFFLLRSLSKECMRECSIHKFMKCRQHVSDWPNNNWGKCKNKIENWTNFNRLKHFTIKKKKL